jgi:hypothetical protein
MNGDTYIYNGNLHLTGDINKGIFNAGTWKEQKKLINYFVMKGVKSLHCLDINNTTELLELYIYILNIDIENLTTSLSILNTDISSNCVNITTLSTLTIL